MRIPAVSLALLIPATAAAQYYQTDFPAEEFRARHAKVFEQIGANAVAVVQGVSQTEGYTLPRQHNTFYYLSGIETPGAYLLLDGRTKMVTIYLPPRNTRLEAAEGRVLSADDADLVKRIAGVYEVKPVTEMTAGNWPLVPNVGTGARGSGRGAAPTPIYAEFSPAENLGQSRGVLVAAETARANGFWDGAPTRHRRARGEPVLAIRRHDRRHGVRVRELHRLPADGARRHGTAGTREGCRAESAARTAGGNRQASSLT